MANRIPIDGSTLLVPDTFRDGFTQSEIGTWDDCAEKWYLGYNWRLAPKGTYSEYFVYGDAFHRTMQSFYTDGSEEVARLQFPEDVIPTAADEAWIQLWQGILDVQMRRYFAYYQDDLAAMTVHKNEEIVQVKFAGVQLQGKLDLVYEVDGDNYLMDHKSGSRFDPGTYAGWQFRFQFMFYLWLHEKAMGYRPRRFMVNGLKKPALRQGKNESMETFWARIEQDMIQRPEEYFKRMPLPYIEGSMKHFEERVLLPKINRINLLTEASTSAIVIESLVRNQNTNNCVKYGKTCQFLPICTHGWKSEGFRYTQRDSKHEELDAAE